MMEILIRKNNLVNGQSKVAFEIPNTAIAIGTLMLTIIQALATALGTYVVSLPQQNANSASNQLKVKNLEIQLLQRILENEDSVARVNSLRLLIAADLISDPDGKVADLLTNPTNIPRWPKHPLETFNGTLEASSSSSVSSNTGAENPSPSGTTQIGSSTIKKP